MSHTLLDDDGVNLLLMNQNQVVEQIKYFLDEGICDIQGATNILLSAEMDNFKVLEIMRELGK